MGDGEAHCLSILSVSGFQTVIPRALDLCYLKCGPWITSEDSNWELVRHAEFQVPYQASKSESAS